MRKGFHRITTVLLGAGIMVGCSQPYETAENNLASHVEDSLGCTKFRSEAFNAAYAYLEEQQSSPSEDRISEKLFDRINSLSVNADKAPRREQLAKEVVRLFQIFTKETEKNFSPEGWLQHLQHLIEFEMEDSSTVTHQKFSKEISTQVHKIQSLAKELELECNVPETPVTEAPPPPPPVEEKRMPAALFGGHFAMANAYQSCQALRLPPINASTDSVVGVVRGQKVDSVGYGREYSSISNIAKTHYYIVGNSYGSGCYSVKDRPLVYDYGGQPAISSQRLNFFSNSGGGGALGVDCSAFVSSALATVGLRYTPNLDNKPVYIRQNSRKFIDPTSSGWKCFDRITLTETDSIQPGDIMSIPGHVVMIDEVGEDPFGLRNATTERDCDVLSSRNFNFVILQSSPSKNSIGINRYVARDYLEESSSMKNGFLQYAKAACRARLQKKAVKLTSGDYSIIRHKGTPECSDKRVEMVNESCIAKCPELN